MGDSKMGLHARLMSQALRKLTGTISKTNCTCFLHQPVKKKIE
jgi:recombination protein RecA